MPTANNILADYLSHDQLAAQLDVHPRTIERWRSQGMGPPVTLIGSVPYYAIDSVRAWLKSRERKMPRERKTA